MHFWDSNLTSCYHIYDTYGVYNIIFAALCISGGRLVCWIHIIQSKIMKLYPVVSHNCIQMGLELKVLINLNKDFGMCMRCLL